MLFSCLSFPKITSVNQSLSFWAEKVGKIISCQNRWLFIRMAEKSETILGGLLFFCLSCPKSSFSIITFCFRQKSWKDSILPNLVSNFLSFQNGKWNGKYSVDCVFGDTPNLYLCFPFLLIFSQYLKSFCAVTEAKLYFFFFVSIKKK